MGFSRFLKGAVSVVAGGVVGFATGGPGGAAIGAVHGRQGFREAEKEAAAGKRQAQRIKEQARAASLNSQVNPAPAALAGKAEGEATTKPAIATVAPAVVLGLGALYLLSRR